MYRGPNKFLMGLNDLDSEDIWQWSDGSEVSYVNWRDDEPNKSPGDGDTVRVLYVGTQWLWFDGPSTLATPFLCSSQKCPQGVLFNNFVNFFPNRN